MGLKDLYDFDSLVNEAERTVLSELETQMAAAADICMRRRYAAPLQMQSRR